MFRLTQYMQGLVSQNSKALRRAPMASKGGTKPVVIWNMLRRCNLACRHCYANSYNKEFSDELNLAQMYKVLDDLKSYGVKVVILSGGEPLLHPHIWEVSQRAKELGFYVALSTNGTLIDEANIENIRDARYNYVGISVDGFGETHDKIRGQKGSFLASMNGVEKCLELGLKVGLRMTVSQTNVHELGDMLDLVDRKNLSKFYLSHLNYSGRGKVNSKLDAHFNMTIKIMDQLFEACLRHIEAGDPRDFVTGNNDADGVYFLQWASSRFSHEKVAELRTKLEAWGGNSSGVGVANIDHLGEVHPDTYWPEHKLGNVRDKSFGEIWSANDPIMTGLRLKPRKIGGRCGECQFLSICNGNTRTRAIKTFNDPWAEDPGCYLDDSVILRDKFRTCPDQINISPLSI